MKTKQILFFSISLFLVFRLNAQSYYTSQILLNRFLANSSFYGVEGVDMGAITNGHMSLIEGHLQQSNIFYQTSMDSLTNRKGFQGGGIGGFANYEVNGALRRFVAQAGYSYKMKLNKNDIIRWGLNFGYATNNLSVGDNPTTNEQKVIDTYKGLANSSIVYGFGAHYIHDGYMEVSFSTPMLSSIMSSDKTTLPEYLLFDLQMKYAYLIYPSLNMHFYPFMDYMQYNSGNKRLNIGAMFSMLDFLDILAHYDAVNKSAAFGFQGASKSIKLFITYNSLMLGSFSSAYGNYFEIGLRTNLSNHVEGTYELDD